MEEERKKTFAEQVSDVLNGTYPKGESVLVREETPFILRQVGFRNLPMLTSQKHITDAVQPKSDKNPHLHGLTVEILNDVPACIESPVMILDSLTNGKSIVVITNKLDSDRLPIIVSIRADGNGMFNHVDIDSNYVTGYYGKDEFGWFLERNLKSGNVIYWDKEKSQALLDSIQLQLPQALISLDSDIIIRKSNAFVNNGDKKNLENTEKKGEDMTPDANNSAQSARERVQQVRDEMVKTLLEHIEKNPTNWQAGWNNIAAGAPYNGKTNTAYRGINALYLAVIGIKRGYSDTRWVTFNQAKELGASVKKGEKSSPVIFFELYDRATKKAFDSNTVKDMTDEEKAAYVKENVYTVLKYSSVFNAEQCYNFPERKEITMSEEERANQNVKIEAIIANSSAPVLFDGGSQAYYTPRTDSIHLPKIEAFDSMQDYYATALHEIAHSTGHESRLNRDLSGGFGSENYAKEELRAELACVFMQMENGIQLNGKHITNHAAYLNSWLEAAKRDNSVFFKAAADAQKIADYVADNYMQAGNVKSPVEEKATQSTTENSMTDYLKADAVKRESEQQNILQSRLNENIREWYLKAYPTDEAGQDIYPDATFKDLLEEVNRANPVAVYGMLADDSIVRERAFSKLAELTNTTYEDIYSAYMGETAAQRLANARAQAQHLAAETGEPYVTIEWSESQELNSYDVMSLSKADKRLAALDSQAENEEGYYKTKLHIDFVFEGEPNSYENCRFDIGSEGGGLVHHIDEFLKYDTFLSFEERSEVGNVLEYFKQHMQVSEYLASPETLAELSEEEQQAVNEYVERARDVLNTTAPFSEYAQKMPPTPEDIEDAIHGYSMEKPNLSLRDLIDEVHEMPSERIRKYAADYRAYLDDGADYMNAMDVQREREEQIAREDYPRDFEDDFTEAMLDAIEEGKFLPSEKENHKEKMTLEEARNAMLDAQVKDVYHFAVRREEITDVDPIDGYESTQPANSYYVIDSYGRVVLWQTQPLWETSPTLPYESNGSREYKEVTFEELEEIAHKMREPIEEYKAVLRAEKEQTEERRRSDAYYEQRAADVLDEHYAAGEGAFVRNLDNPRYLNGTLYSEHTRTGYQVINITKDEENRNIAIIKRQSDFMVAANYDTDDGTWGQGFYGFENQKSAEEFRTEKYGAADKGKIVNLSAEQFEGIMHGAEVLDNLKTYDKWKSTNSQVLQEYLKIKYENPSYTVFYRLGDFYEVFGADAERASQKLDLTLTGRDAGTTERIPMCGVPNHKIDEYAAKLADAGESVVIADGKDIRRVEATKSERVTSEQSEVKIQEMSNTKNEKSIADELTDKSVWLKINLPESAIGNQYGNTTLVRMPDGEFSHFGVFIPSKFIKNENGKAQLNVGSKFTYRLSNDGREVNLTGQELADSFAGKTIGKEIVRVAPSRKYAQTLANLEKNVPSELKEIPNWCCYRTKWNEEKGKKDKFIISPMDGKWASSKEANRWTTFDAALKYARENNCEGLSLLLDRQYGITCIDLDKCITDAKTGAMKERATKLVKELEGTYIERSTSGNGIHIFLKDDILKNGTYNSTSMTKDDDPKGDLEVFDDKHIISMTGDMLSANNNLTRAGSAATVYLRQELGERRQQASGGIKPQPHSSTNLSDKELIQWIQRSKQSSKFNELYYGKGVSGDRSADDGKLAHMLLYFNGGDKEQAFRIMRESGLNRTDKPDSYYRHTIDKMDEKITEYAKRPSLGASKQQGKSAAGSSKPGAQA